MVRDAQLGAKAADKFGFRPALRSKRMIHTCYLDEVRPGGGGKQEEGQAVRAAGHRKA